MLCLAIDTSSHVCAAALYDHRSDVILAQTSENIGRGHAERLMDVIAGCLEQSRLAYSDIERIITTVGPGSFTGVRVGLATARGLALGLSIPAVGISNLDILEQEAGMIEKSEHLVTMIDAKRDEAFVQWSGDTNPSQLATACTMTYDGLQTLLSETQPALCGSGASIFASRFPGRWNIVHELAAAPIATVAKMGAQQPLTESRPEPLYLRSPDAKPQSGFKVATIV